MLKFEDGIYEAPNVSIKNQNLGPFDLINL